MNGKLLKKYGIGLCCISDDKLVKVAAILSKKYYSIIEIVKIQENYGIEGFIGAAYSLLMTLQERGYSITQKKEKTPYGSRIIFCVAGVRG